MESRARGGISPIATAVSVDTMSSQQPPHQNNLKPVFLLIGSTGSVYGAFSTYAKALDARQGWQKGAPFQIQICYVDELNKGA